MAPEALTKEIEMNTTTIATVGQRFCVVGMTCHHCEMAVTAELSKLSGVTRVVVDVAAGTVITESVDPLGLDDVAAAIDEAGYELAR
jgi:copper chaperone CopZ